MADWNEQRFIEDLKKLFGLRDFYRQLEKLELLLAPEFRARLETKLNVAAKSKLIAELFKEIPLLGLDKQVRKNELVEFISRCSTQRIILEDPPTFERPEILRRIKRAFDEARAALGKYPSCVEKTYSFFRAALQREGSTEGYVLLVDSLSSEARNDPKLAELAKGVGASSLGREAFDNVARYRFLAAFASSTGRETIDEVIDFFRRTLNEVDQTELDDTSLKLLYPGAYPVGELLWLVSRAPSLARNMRPEIRRTLDKVMEAQDRRGWWPEQVFSNEMPSEHKSAREKVFGSLVPDPAATAVCAAALQKLGDDRHIDAATKAAQWLATVQGPLGSWSALDHRGKSESDLLTTIVTMEVIRRAGFNDIERNILLAEQWVISRQDTIGLWVEKGHDDEFLSVAICEYFRDREKFKPLPLGLLTVARGFLRRAEELALDRSSDAARLAVVSAFHGAEMFLYGVAADDRFNFDIFDKSGNTIGLRGALTQLRDKLRQRGMINETSDLRWSTQMKAIASLRDQIVHKGHEATSETAVRHVSEAVDFVSYYGEQLLQLQILDK